MCFFMIGHLLKTKLRFAAELPHIWWGVSVENRRHGLSRIDHLRSADPAMAFLSIEPLLEDLGQIDLRSLRWVIVGGESGAGARRMEKNWVVNIRDQCMQAGVPFFFKQWGGTRKNVAGRELDGHTYDELPLTAAREVPHAITRKVLAAEYARAWADISLICARRSA